jgi:general secretion pathway protein C
MNRLKITYLIALILFCSINLLHAELLPQMNLNLLGTLIESDPMKSIAILEDITTHKQSAFKAGDDLYEYKIVKIGRGEISLLKDGKVDRIEFPLGNVNQAVVSVSDHEKIIDRKAIVKMFPDLNIAIKQAFAVPHFESGKITGFKITKLRDKELAQKVGIEEGDILLGINEYKFDSVKSPFQIYHNLRNASELNIQIKRNNETKNLVYYLK